MTMKKATRPEQKISPKQGSQEVSKTGVPSYLSPFDEMTRIMDSFFPRGWIRPYNREWPSLAEVTASFEAKLPRVDVLDKENTIVVNAEIPGVSRENIDVSLKDNILTIRGKSEQKKEEEKGEYYRREISRGEFSRSVALPADVDGAKAKATFKDGLLELTIPKSGKTTRYKVNVD